jgi:hypothetical protein
MESNVKKVNFGKKSKKSEKSKQSGKSTVVDHEAVALDLIQKVLLSHAVLTYNPVLVELISAQILEKLVDYGTLPPQTYKGYESTLNWIGKEI